LNLALIPDHLTDLAVGEEYPHPVVIVAFDDERFVKLRLTHLDVLHSQQLAHVAEESLA
jgi:hypothetical protein